MRILALAAATTLACLGTPALAQRATGPYVPPNGYSLATPPGLEFDLSAGYLNAISREYVYDVPNKRKLSQLNWRDVSVYGVNGAFGFRFLPWLTGRVSGFFPIGGNSKMDDYDWIPPNVVNGVFSDHSQHKDTRVQNGYKLDFSLQGDFLTTDATALGLVVGYERQNWKWKAHGGTYDYSTKAPHDTSGTFDPSELGIAYRQWYDAPYLGLAGTVQVGDLKLTARGIGSPYVFAKSRDLHALRVLVVKDSFSPGQMLGGDLRAEYALTQNLAVVGTASYERFFQNRGRAHYYFGDEGVSAVQEPGTSGLDRKAAILTLGLSARM